MNPRRNRLLTAIKSAQNHVQSSNVSQLDDKLESNKSGKILINPKGAINPKIITDLSKLVILTR